ncbi:MAG: hypothetical protein IID28_08100 [Planctomycetes bacterium]|nr:hypothetical protein [Planctomycetota bacterium]
MSGLLPAGAAQAEIVDEIPMRLQLQEPACPWDCGLPTDKSVGIVDFLALLGQWGMIGTSCDFDGEGVGITDFLALLGHWGTCPAPANDECLDKIIIERLSFATIDVQFDMWGATPSPETSQCTGVDPNPYKDIWYCLQNGTNDTKIVTLTGSVDLLAEVTAGCACPPGPLVTCGRLIDPKGVTTFTMPAGDAVCIRLLNDLGLPNDQIKGSLVITNEPAGPPSEKCFNQPPNQANGLFSDLDCDICFAGGNPPQQVLAEQLVLVAPEMIDELRFWGGYFPGDAGGVDPLPDNFTVKFRLNDDSTGIDVPGEVVRKIQVGPATTRTETGLSLFGVREFEYTIDLEPNQDLQPGFYWVEIYNDTTNDPTDDDWFWETGTLDRINGLPGSVFSFDPPNVLPKGWMVDPINELSLTMTCKPQPPNVNFFVDPAAFADAVQQAGTPLQFTWDFSPNDLPAASAVSLDDPLDINTHGDDPDDPWGALWPPAVDNVQFTSNMNPAGPLAPAGIDGLVFKTAGFLNLVNDMLGANTLTDSFDIVSGAVNPDVCDDCSASHTAISMNLMSQALAGSPVAVLLRVTVYGEQDQVLGAIDIPALDNEKVFLGVITKDDLPIGRIDIWDMLSDGATNGAEGISSMTAYLASGSVDECNGDPTCHECETPAGDCLCVQGVPCFLAEPCVDGMCPPGFFCCTNTCCGGSICLPVCGSPLAAEPPPVVSPDEIFSGGAAYETE